MAMAWKHGFNLPPILRSNLEAVLESFFTEQKMS